MTGSEEALLRARGLAKRFGSGEGLVRAVDDVDLDVDPGEALAVIGLDDVLAIYSRGLAWSTGPTADP